MRWAVSWARYEFPLAVVEASVNCEGRFVVCWDGMRRVVKEEESKDLLKLFTRWSRGHEEETNCGRGARTTGSGPPAQMRAGKR